MTPKEAEKKYGKEVLKKMDKYLRGITVTLLPSGEMDIPQSDLDRAYREVLGDEVHWAEWD